MHNRVIEHEMLIMKIYLMLYYDQKTILSVQCITVVEFTPCKTASAEIRHCWPNLKRWMTHPFALTLSLV